MTIADFKKYQEAARKTAMYPQEHKIIYPALGLVGEAGEVANKAKKLLRGDKDPAELLEGIKSELGDVLWYLSALADDLGIDLGQVAQENIDKLQSRQVRGVIKASGDNR